MIYALLVLILFAVELLYFKIADRFNIIDKPNQRSSHTKITLRGGGIIFLLGVWLYAIFYGLQYPFFLVGLTAIAGVSFVDDVKTISNRVRLIVQFTAMVLIFYQWGILTFASWWMFPIALICCVGVINAFNFLDGINGMTGLYSLSVLLPLFFLNESIHFMDAHLIVVSIISVGVFLFFNLRKRATCFAGDVGAVGIAFILLFMLGLLVVQTNDLSYLILLGVYGVDSILTIIHRLLLHDNIFVAHRKHAYQLLANELKVPHVVVSGIYFFIQLAVTAGFLWSGLNHWVYFVGVLVVMCLGYVLFMKKYYWMHMEYLNNQ